MSEGELAAAVAALRAGELVVFPTETLYGIGCDALDPRAVARLCAVKQRPDEKGIAVVLGSSAMIEQVCPQVSPAAAMLMRAFWPGPLTLLVAAKSGLPAPIVSQGRIGVRVSSHPLTARLSRELGRPIAAPSANPSGREPARDVASARAYFGEDVAVYLDGGVIEGAPSTLVDPGPPLRVLREGAISASLIAGALDD